MDRWQSEAKHSRMKIKNAVRIIDERIETLTEMIADRKENPLYHTKNMRDSNDEVIERFERESLLLQEIRDKLIPEEKSI